MSVAWPPSLPQTPLIRGYTEGDVDTSIRNTMEAGVAKARQRTSAKERVIAWPLILTTAQKQTLQTFWKDDTKGGTIIITGLIRPGEISSEDARIRTRPTYSAITGSLWRTVLDIEFLPT